MEIESIKSVGTANSGTTSYVPLQSSAEEVNFVKPVVEHQKESKVENDDTNSNQHDANVDKSIENKKVSKSTIDNTISETNSKIKVSNTQLKYSIDDETQRISIKIIDKDTDKVIREVPPEETLEAIKKIWEIAGIIVDEKR
jgi:flagellar protein flaG protein